jgi:hypothetical protein
MITGWKEGILGDCEFETYWSVNTAEPEVMIFIKSPRTNQTYKVEMKNPYDFEDRTTFKLWDGKGRMLLYMEDGRSTLIEQFIGLFCYKKCAEQFETDIGSSFTIQSKHSSSKGKTAFMVVSDKGYKANIGREIAEYLAVTKALNFTNADITKTNKLRVGNIPQTGAVSLSLMWETA